METHFCFFVDSTISIFGRTGGRTPVNTNEKQPQTPINIGDYCSTRSKNYMLLHFCNYLIFNEKRDPFKNHVCDPVGTQ